ncbi:metallophosphoesterase family protein [Cohnella cellulosilytica]|uniref:Metallophosphoesterase family protein n=1 Tax=Cohnella cellulosilytica TaxID=986710 RepID=A0ABW2F467_9BACL
MSSSLKFRADGTFTIVQFTDLHWTDGGKKDALTRALMERILEEERPDLVVLTGDVIDSLRCADPLRSFREALSAVVGSGIPWAAIFGNHDSEGDVARERLLDVQLELAGTIAQPSPHDISGVGNFVARIEDAAGRTGAALYFLDSGAYSELPGIDGYDWVRANQIAWFREQAGALRRDNGGIPVPALLFLHIPFPEYREIWNTRVCRGRRFEKVHAPGINSGLFAALVETGGTAGVFCGHDHINDYIGELDGIRLGYGRATGYNTYGRWFYQRGARIIRLRDGEPGFSTWLRLANGRKVGPQPRHSPHWFSRA